MNLRSLYALIATALLASSAAHAQTSPPPMRPPPKDAPPPKPAGPPGPRSGGGDDDQGPSPSQKPTQEPTVLLAEDPLKIPDEIKDRIGTDTDGRPPSPEGSLHRSYFPYYEEQRGEYRFRLLPPLYLEHTRGVGKTDEKTGASLQDRESLFALLYYQRRSLKLDADVLFPLIWRTRNEQSHSFVFGPFVHREAPLEHDNWLAPLYFQGKRKDGGYFHTPLLLMTSHWGEKGAFTLIGPYFRDRSGTDVDMGVAPLFFHGDNGDTTGARKTYTLIPPLLFYQRDRELEDTHLTVVGPVISQSTPKRSIFDIAPIFFSIRGKPETGGVRESHTTVFPLFHYGVSEQQSLFATPLYLRRVTKTADTLMTPFVTHATKRNGASSTWAAGPIVPIFYRHTDTDIGESAFGIFPLVYHSTSPANTALLTPLFGRFESRSVSRSYWFFPTLTVSTDAHGWETNFHPLVYTGRSDQNSHAVFAPLYWDFKSATSRQTIGFPLLWRFANYETQSVTQVAVNTLYMEKKVRGGTDWQFHFLPLLSFGGTPEGHWWNILFGLTGYERDGSYARAKAFWIPFQVSGPSTKAAADAR